jgi:hypothetical protein
MGRRNWQTHFAVDVRTTHPNARALTGPKNQASQASMVLLRPNFKSAKPGIVRLRELLRDNAANMTADSGYSWNKKPAGNDQ